MEALLQEGPTLTTEQARAIAVDAYVYFYSLVTMDVSRKQFTNIEAGKEFGKGPMNMFVNVPAYPPADFKGVVRSNFDTLYSIPQDYPAVNKIQAALQVVPLSGWGKPPKPIVAKIDPSVDMKTPPKTQVDTMLAGAYFAYAAELLKVHPPHLTDEPIIAQMKQIGIEPGKSFDISKLDPDVRKGVEAAPAEAQQLMTWKVPTVARVANYWSMNTDTMGVYGNYYLKRAIVAQLGLGANLLEDAIYPLNLGDETGKPLDGTNKYTIHFEKGATPPVAAFWSLTLYDPDGFQVANELNRFAVSSWMPFQYNADGSLDLYFQNDSPGKDKAANWLPAPKGPFNLTMRLYSPEADALTGKWNPPPVKRVGAKQ
jgi:hypothetical protein